MPEQSCGGHTVRQPRGELTTERPDAHQHDERHGNADDREVGTGRGVEGGTFLLRHAQAAGVRADWVRAGIVVYGSAPDFPEHNADHWGLQPTMTLSTRLIATQQLQAGDTVGYGSRFTADGPLTGPSSSLGGDTARTFEID